MRRTSPLLRATNLILAPAARRGTTEPDRVFNRIIDTERRRNDSPEIAMNDAVAIERLRFLLHCFARVEGLSGVGWKSAIDVVSSKVGNLYAIRRFQGRYGADLTSQPIKAPIFIVGLPRTATTLTQKVLANSAGVRAPLAWEMYNIGLEPDAASRKRMVRSTQRRLDQTLALSPTWDLIHPIKATDPEEDYFLRPHSPFHAGLAPMDDYLEFLDGYDFRLDYQFLKEALQVLSYRRPEATWVIKHPLNVLYLREILAVFPDARIVWTHRNPVTVMGSMCSLVESLHHLHLKRGYVDYDQIGRTWLRILSEGIADARQARIGLPRASIIDVPYYQMASAAHEYVPGLYERLGLAWGEGDAANLDEALKRPRPHTWRRHEYMLSRYGLDAGTVEDAFGDYIGFVGQLELTH